MTDNPPDWMTEGAHPVRKAQIERDWRLRHRSLRGMAATLGKAASEGVISPMRANDLLIAGFCEALLEGSRDD